MGHSANKRAAGPVKQEAAPRKFHLADHSAHARKTMSAFRANPTPAETGKPFNREGALLVGLFLRQAEADRRADSVNNI
jgi:hypothetical protein